MKKILKKMIVYFITLAMAASVFAGIGSTGALAGEYPPYDGTGNLFLNGDFSNGTNNLGFNASSGYGTYAIENNALKFTVTKFHDTDRNVFRLDHLNISLEAGKRYKITFWVKSSETIRFKYVSPDEADASEGRLKAGSGQILIRAMTDANNALKNSSNANVEYTVPSDNGEFLKDEWKKVEATLNTEGCSISSGQKVRVRFFLGSGIVVENEVQRRQKEDGSPFTIILDNFEIREETPKATISLTADGAGENDVVLAGGGSVDIGQKATIKASVKNGANYVFEKWVDETNTTISSDPIYTFTVNSSKTYKAVFKQLPKYTVEVSTNGLGTVSPSKSGPYNYDETVTLTATPNPGYVFVCWEENGREVSKAAIYNLTVKGNCNIKAYFAESGKHKVTFKESGGRVFKIESVENGKSATAPTDTDVLKPGYEFVAWDKGFSNITGDTEITAIYKQSAVKYNVSIQNGTIDGFGSSGQYEFDTLVTVRASDINNFSYWKDSTTNKILCYDSTYSFYVSGNISLTAVNNAADVQKQPIAAINSVIQGKGTVSFVAQCTVPTSGGFTVVEYGVLISNTNSNLDLGASDVIRGRAGSKTSTGQFMITKANAAGQWYGRAYIICRDGSGNLVTMYSDVKSGTAQ